MVKVFDKDTYRPSLAKAGDLIKYENFGYCIVLGFSNVWNSFDPSTTPISNIFTKHRHIVYLELNLIYTHDVARGTLYARIEYVGNILNLSYEEIKGYISRELYDTALKLLSLNQIKEELRDLLK